MASTKEEDTVPAVDPKTEELPPSLDTGADAEAPGVTAAAEDAAQQPAAESNSTASTVFTRTATFLSATKERVGSAVVGAVGNAAHLAKNFSSRQAPGGTQQEPGDASSLPAMGERQSSMLDQLVDDRHARAVALANSILDFSNEVALKVEASVVRTRESTLAATWRTYQTAVQGLRRLTAPSRRVTAVCKADLRTKPVPQVLLLCCNHVATQGLSSAKLFQEPHPPAATVEALSQRLEDRLVLLPVDLDPAVAAAIITHFLRSLEEPLLTFKLVDRWVAAGRQLTASDDGGAGGVHELLSHLPLANWSTLKLLVETLYRVASQSNVTGMNAQALSEVLAPVLLWREHPPLPAPAGAPPTMAAASGTTTASRSGTGSAGASSAQVVVAQASQMASATLQAIKSKLYPAAATAAAPAAAVVGDPEGAASPTAVAAAAAAAPETLAVTDAAPPPRAPRMVLDEDEDEDGGAEVSKQDAARLEQSVLQQQGEGAGGKVAIGGEPEAAAPSAGGAGAMGKVPLEPEELAAAAGLLRHVIENYDDLFVLEA